MGGFRGPRAFVCLSALGFTFAAAPAALGEEQQAAWPVGIINQPSTLPVRAWSGALGAQSNHNFTNVSLTFGGLAGASYGFTNSFTAGVSYDLLVASPDHALGTGPLLANVVYSIYADGPLEVTVGGSAGYAFDQKQVAPLTLGIATPWNVLDWLTIGAAGDQFAFGLASPNEITFAMPLSVGFQLWPWLWAGVDINIFRMNVRSADKDKSLFTLDEIGVGPELVYSPTRQWDLLVGGSLNPVPPGQDSVGASLQWTASVTYYGNVAVQ